eukprot:14909642-Ditylum_brightwellii.AAC.1
MLMPEVNKVFYAKNRENGSHYIAYILLSLNHDMEFLVVWINHPSWGGLDNIDKSSYKQRKGRKENNLGMMY